MQASEHQIIAERHPEPPAFQSEAPVSGGTSGSAALLDPLELESLKLIMDAALRVHARSEEHTSELQSQSNLVCRLLLEKKKTRFPVPCSWNIAPSCQRTSGILPLT